MEVFQLKKKKKKEIKPSYTRAWVTRLVASKDEMNEGMNQAVLLTRNV